VLYRPPVKPTTWLLWFGPFALLAGAVAGLIAYLRRRAARVQPAHLSAADKASAEALLADTPPSERPRMTAFWIAAGLLTALSLAVLCWPLLRRRENTSASRRAINAAIFRDHGRPGADLASGTLSQGRRHRPGRTRTACSRRRGR
jgi:hypothetical protein